MQCDAGCVWILGYDLIAIWVLSNLARTVLSAASWHGMGTLASVVQ